jgi:hypothetical protein
VGSQADKERLFELLYNAKEASLDEKAEAWDRFYQEVDRVRNGTPYSRSMVREFLHKTGYREYARRRQLAERANI